MGEDVSVHPVAHGSERGTRRHSVVREGALISHPPTTGGDAQPTLLVPGMELPPLHDTADAEEGRSRRGLPALHGRAHLAVERSERGLPAMHGAADVIVARSESGAPALHDVAPV